MSSVLITGANRGLGLEFAAEYAADGWTLAACRSPAEAEQLEDLALEDGDRVSVFWMDVTDMGSIRKAAMQLKDATIDVSINNAGIGGPRGQTTGNVDDLGWALRFRREYPGSVAGTRSIHRAACTERAQAGVTNHEWQGFNWRQYFGRLFIAYRSSRRGEHGHAKCCNRSWPTSYHARARSPGGETDMGGPGARPTAQQSVSAMRGSIRKTAAR